MLADALLRGVAGSSAQLRVTGTNPDSNQSEVGLLATTFSQIVVSPVVMRKLHPTFKEGDAPRWGTAGFGNGCTSASERAQPSIRRIAVRHDTCHYDRRARIPD